ncbi:hypothetical protein MHH33_08640 [Paenisporosarcina sp. FSL H8-0542]|uniref:hypothetical protein n=1 Tax=Paenisporosarcina sp. FSL H8-0542 TaxID=2921401 RepID=UPI00315A6506
MKRWQKNQWFFLILSIFLVGCAPDVPEIKDGNSHVTEEMDEVISDYIVEKYKGIYYPSEKQFEVHRIYGTSEENGVINVNMWSYFSGFNKANGVESQSGHSLPALIQLKKTDSGYEVIKYIEPKEGNQYASSIKKMFPEKYAKIAVHDAETIESLEKEMSEKVEDWLNEK